MKPNLLIAALAVMFTAGCAMSSRAPSGYERVTHRMRLFPRNLTHQLTPTNGVIKVAVAPSSTYEFLAWCDLEVVEGSITITGRNCTLILEKDDKITLDIQNDGTYTGSVTSVGGGIRFVVNSCFPEQEPYIRFRFSADSMCRTTPDEHEGKKYGRIYKVERTWENTGRGNEQRLVELHYERREKGFEPYLHSVTNNGWRCVDIPYSISPDFKGNMGKLWLNSNWYEY